MINIKIKHICQYLLLALITFAVLPAHKEIFDHIAFFIIGLIINVYSIISYTIEKNRYEKEVNTIR